MTGSKLREIGLSNTLKLLLLYRRIFLLGFRFELYWTISTYYGKYINFRSEIWLFKVIEFSYDSFKSIFLNFLNKSTFFGEGGRG
jgi:hypothetical protein